jgi:hypothetical protein
MTHPRPVQASQFQGHGTKFPRRKEKAIVALLESNSLEAAAGQAGVARSTLQTWMKDPEFMAEYSAAKRRLLDVAILALRRLALTAVTTLGSICQDEEAGASVRVSAAARMLDAVLSAAHHDDVVQRIDALERRLGVAL